MRPKNSPAGRQIALPRPVAALAHQLARAEERAVQVVIERALKLYAQQSPEWQTIQKDAYMRSPEGRAALAKEWPYPLPPERNGNSEHHDGSGQNPERQHTEHEAG